MGRHNRKTRVAALFLGGFFGIAMLAGCGQTQQTAVPEENTEQSAVTGETVAEAEVLNNNGHFVQIGDTVYFHITDADSMGESTLWAQYADSLCGRTVLMACATDAESAEPVAYDYTSGGIAVQGDVLYSQAYAESESNPELPDSIISSYSRRNGEQHSNIAEKNAVLIGADLQGNFVAVHQPGYLEEDAPDRIQIYRNGSLQNTFDVEGFYGCIRADEKAVYYIRDNQENTYTLQQLDITSGETVNLGTLPGFEYSQWVGVVDECMIVDDSIYFTYSDYEGTGNFFQEGYFVQAKTGVEDSLTYTDMQARMVNEEALFVPFAVVDGQMVEADGEPGTCSVQEGGVLGYYDEQGTWTPVAEGWDTEFVSGEGDYNGVELAEKVGDYIYVVYNSNARVPADDIGWRYAYCRNYTDIFRVSIETGEAVQLLHQAAPWSD